jgi:hypothetical protein
MLHKLGKQIVPFLTHYLKLDLTKSLNKYLNEKINPDANSYPYTVVFKNAKGNNAYVNGLKMVIDDEALDTLSLLVVDFIETYTIDNGSGDRLFDDFFIFLSKISEGVAGPDLYEDLKKTLNVLASVIIHESVHLVQHSRQYMAGRQSTEYRSYLDPKRSTFPELQRQKDWSRDPENMKLYRASPQEITAFSHEYAMDIINDYQSTSELDLLKDPQLLAQEIYDKLKKKRIPNGEGEQKVFQRYAKLIYQEISRYLDQVEQK